MKSVVAAVCANYKDIIDFENECS